MPYLVQVHAKLGQQLQCSLHNDCIHCIYLVPANPVSAVCPVYDMVNGTLQIIETTWNEVVRQCCSLQTINYYLRFLQNHN